MKNNGLGLVHVYTGNGKGKTTASLGLALRALGHGYKVCVVQFLKGASYSGEVLASKNLPNLTIAQFGEPCPWGEQIAEGKLECGSCRFCFSVYSEDKKKAGEALEYAKKVLSSGEYGLVILDEINNALFKNLVPIEHILKLIVEKSQHTELVLTGRNAPPELLGVADIVTEMKEVKHPLKKGVGSRRGIEY